MESCRTVYLVCGEFKSAIPYGQVVSRGTIYGDCEVTIAVPDKCVVTPITRVKFTNKYEIDFKELKKNIALIKVIGKKKYAFVYPKKLINRIMNDYIKPMIRGDAPETSGLLLVGAPGTGKTSLAELLAEHLGIPVYFLEPDIKSKYLGETEHNLKKLIKEAIASEPSIIIIDDCEWLLSGRRLTSPEEQEIKLTTRRIMLKYMQEITNKGKRVLFIATTNMKPDIIDIAFRRPGRFGDPIIVPLPDLEAIDFLLDFYGAKKKDKIAIKLLNAGASASHVVNVAKKLARGEEFRIEPQSFRGYRRYYVEPIKEFRRIFDYIPEQVFSRPSRIYMSGDIDIMTAISLQIVSSARKSAIIVNDPKYIDEAVHTANMYESVIILPTLLNGEIQYYVHSNADTPVIYVGVKQPLVPAIPLFSITSLQKIVGIEALVRAIVEYKQIKLSEEDIKKTVDIVREYTSVEKALYLFSSLGVINDKVLRLF